MDQFCKLNLHTIILLSYMNGLTFQGTLVIIYR